MISIWYLRFYQVQCYTGSVIMTSFNFFGLLSSGYAEWGEVWGAGQDMLKTGCVCVCVCVCVCEREREGCSAKLV